MSSRWTCNQREIWVRGWEPLTVSQRHALFGVIGSSTGGDIIYFVCYMVSHDHLIEESPPLAVCHHPDKSCEAL